MPIPLRMQFPKDHVELFEFISSRTFSQGDLALYHEEIPRTFHLLFVSRMESTDEYDLRASHWCVRDLVKEKLRKIPFEKGILTGVAYEISDIPESISVETLNVVFQIYHANIEFVEACFGRYTGTFAPKIITGFTSLLFWNAQNYQEIILKIIKRTQRVPLYAIENFLDYSYNPSPPVIFAMFDKCEDPKTDVFYTVAKENIRIAKVYFARYRNEITCTKEIYSFFLKNDDEYYFHADLITTMKNITLEDIKTIGVKSLRGLFFGKAKVVKRRYDDPANAPYREYLEIADYGESETCQLCLLDFEEGDEKIFSDHCDYSYHKDCVPQHEFRCVCGGTQAAPTAQAPPVARAFPAAGVERAIPVAEPTIDPVHEERLRLQSLFNEVREIARNNAEIVEMQDRVARELDPATAEMMVAVVGNLFATFRTAGDEDGDERR